MQAQLGDSPTDDMTAAAIAVARGIPLEVVQTKGHGHGGTAMALAPLMHVLFSEVMRHDPAEPDWEGRDRFVLSAGHASLALYVQLYLTGYGLELPELAKARAYNSRTPGHPEIGVTPGVEVSTGPLGQGLATAVGLAAALWHKQALLGDCSLFDQTVWVVAGDGCLQEGVSSEASSLAGTLSLPNLVVVWDDNDVTIDGNSAVSFREDTRARYESYGWTVLDIPDANDVTTIRKVLEEARSIDGPVLVAYRSVIGWPSRAMAGQPAAHAGPFGKEEVAATKSALGFSPGAALEDLVSEEILSFTRRSLARGEDMRKKWLEELDRKVKDDPDFAGAYRFLHDHVGNKSKALEVLKNLHPLASDDAATRVTNGKVMNALIPLVPMWGGSADLSQSTSVAIEGTGFSAEDPKGSFWNFGIREHAMAAILNGIAIEGTWRPYGSTYLAFSDYLRPALRIGALMELPVVLVFTHDSVAVGEDGPTHQPVEQISGMRMIPGVAVARPADSAEVLGVWERAIEDPDGPLVLALSRQALPALNSKDSITGAKRGGYVVWQSGTGLDVALLATGSEVHLACEAAKELTDQGLQVRVVSIPVTSWFDAQSDEYQNEVLPSEISMRIAIEAGSAAYWWKYVGLNGRVIGIDSFGASGSGQQILELRGISTENLLQVAREALES